MKAISDNLAVTILISVITIVNILLSRHFGQLMTSCSLEGGAPTLRTGFLSQPTQPSHCRIHCATDDFGNSDDNDDHLFMILAKYHQ